MKRPGVQRRRLVKRLQIGVILIAAVAALLVLPTGASAAKPTSASLPPNSVFTGTHPGGAIRLFANPKGYLVRIEVEDILGTSFDTGEPCSFDFNGTFSHALAIMPDVINPWAFIAPDGDFESSSTSGFRIVGAFAGKVNVRDWTNAAGYLYKYSGSGCNTDISGSVPYRWAVSTASRVPRQKCKKGRKLKKGKCVKKKRVKQKRKKALI